MERGNRVRKRFVEMWVCFKQLRLKCLASSDLKWVSDRGGLQKQRRAEGSKMYSDRTLQSRASQGHCRQCHP